MNDFVFLRPIAFVFLIPALLFCFNVNKGADAWFKTVDAHLWPFLSLKAVGKKRKIISFLSFFAALCAVVAMVGVSFRKKDTELYQAKTPAVIMADLSLSMRAGDVYPNRFSAMQFKIYDILRGLKGMPVGFGVFAAEPYALLPTTTDGGVIENILPLLSFDLIPEQGSRIDRALDEAVRMLEASGASGGDVFLLTDGGEDALLLQDEAVNKAKRFARNGGRIFISGIGTAKGGAVMLKNDVPVRDRQGNPVRHTLKEDFLKRLASAGNGAYASVAADGSDTAFLMSVYARPFKDADETDMKNNEDFADEGWLFLFPALFLFPFLFKKGACLTFLIFFLNSGTLFANEWFTNPPTRAAKALEAGDTAAAMAIAWQSDDFKTYYNVGTVLIGMKKYDEASEMLKRAVDKKPSSEDAQINLEIAERLREKPPSDGGEGDNENDPTGSGSSESQDNDLNQNINSSSQHNENKEENSQNTTSDADGGESPDNADGNNGDGEGSDAEGKDDSDGNDGRDGGENGNNHDNGSDEKSDKSGENPDDKSGNGGEGDGGDAEGKDDSGGNDNRDGGENGNAPDNGGGDAEDEGSGAEDEGKGGGSGETDNGDGRKRPQENNPPSSDNGKKGYPKIPNDPSLLLKQKILFQHLSGRYPPETVKGAEW